VTNVETRKTNQHSVKFKNQAMKTLEINY